MYRTLHYISGAINEATRNTLVNRQNWNCAGNSSDVEFDALEIPITREAPP